MKAQCLCGNIAFEFDVETPVVMNCFCSICRRSHGAAYATQLMSKKSSLVFTQGQELLKEYASSEHGIRAFCSTCGSRLMNYAKRGSDYMSVSLSAVSDTHSVKPCANVQLASKAAWVEPDPSIDSFDVLPPDILQYLG